MAKETEKRLIRTLEFLKEPQGSTIPAIVKVMNGESPQVSLKRIVQTLKGCVDNGLVKVTEGRIKLRQVNLNDPKMEEDSQAADNCGRSRSGCSKPACPNSPVCPMKVSKCPPKKPTKPKCPKIHQDPGNEGENVNDAEGEGGEGEGEGEGKNLCPPCPKCPKKKKNKCVKKKPRCAKPKRKPKCGKPKRKPKKCPKKCPKRKIQPYCKKKKKCG